MSALPPADARKLSASLSMLASPVDGEKLAAVHAIARLLTKNGLGFDDLAAPATMGSSHLAVTQQGDADDPKAWRRAMYPERSGPPQRAEITREHQRTALRLIYSATNWSPTERDFLASMSDRREQPSCKQAEWLVDLERKARRQRTDREMAA